MGAVAAVVADVVWTAVVAKATTEIVSKVAEEIGVSEDAANLLGVIAGGYAGMKSWGAASGSISEATGWQDFSNPFVGGGATQAPAVEAPSAGAGGGAGAGAGTAPQVQTPGAPAPGTPAPPAPTAEAPWWKSNTAQTLMAGGVSGMAQGAMMGEQAEDELKEQRRREDREEELEEERVQDWKASAQPIFNQAPRVQTPTAARPMLDMPTPGGGGLLTDDDEY